MIRALLALAMMGVNTGVSVAMLAYALWVDAPAWTAALLAGWVAINVTFVTVTVAMTNDK